MTCCEYEESRFDKCKYHMNGFNVSIPKVGYGTINHENRGRGAKEKVKKKGR